jgi:nucleoid-associated protein YgaU
LAARNPKTKVARPEEFVDLTFIKELDSSGYIDRLYRTQPVVATRQERPPAAPAVASTKVPAPPKATPTPPAAAVKSAATPTAPIEGSQEHIVVSGDTLSHLAIRFYGDQYKWSKIYEANKSMMKNPHFLYIGQKLVIPS